MNESAQIEILPSVITLNVYFFEIPYIHDMFQIVLLISKGCAVVLFRPCLYDPWIEE